MYVSLKRGSALSSLAQHHLYRVLRRRRGGLPQPSTFLTTRPRKKEEAWKKKRRRFLRPSPNRRLRRPTPPPRVCGPRSRKLLCTKPPSLSCSSTSAKPRTRKSACGKFWKSSKMNFRKTPDARSWRKIAAPWKRIMQIINRLSNAFGSWTRFYPNTTTVERRLDILAPLVDPVNVTGVTGVLLLASIRLSCERLKILHQHAGLGGTHSWIILIIFSPLSSCYFRHLAW